MRFSFLALIALATVAFAGPVFAEDAQQAPAAEQTAEAVPMANPMGAGLIVPSGEAGSPISPDEGIKVYAQPDLGAEVVGTLQSTGSTIEFQQHVLVKKGPDPEWKPSFFNRLFNKKAPIIEVQTPVSEFMLSPEQKGVMIVNVQGSWLQIAQGWFQWTQKVANHARFLPWSELYQQASFTSFQLSSARTDKADIMPLTEVILTEDDGTQTKVNSPARFILIKLEGGKMRVRLTAGTCQAGGNPLVGEGKEGVVSMFAPSGSPQLWLQPEVCPVKE